MLLKDYFPNLDKKYHKVSFKGLAFNSKEIKKGYIFFAFKGNNTCLLYTSPSPRDPKTSRMPSSA